MAKKKTAEEAGREIGAAIGKEIDKGIKNEGGCDVKHVHHRSGGDVVYCIGVIGAAVYFIQHATGFWVGVLGLLKAFVWPAILIYKAFGVLG